MQVQNEIYHKIDDLHSPIVNFSFICTMYIATIQQQIVFAVYNGVVFHIMISLIAPNREAIEPRIPSG
jgi:hypothetical protein